MKKTNKEATMFFRCSKKDEQRAKRAAKRHGFRTSTWLRLVVREALDAIESRAA